jgi:hypothetical protein
MEMYYDNARGKIDTGDLIAVKAKKGLLTPFTRFFTRSPYTHVGTAFWMGESLWVAEINNGANHATPLSQFADCDFDVCSPPLGVDVERMQTAIMIALRGKIHYGWLSLPFIGLLAFLKIRTFLHARRILSCAGFSVFIYEMAGMKETTRILAPVDLVKMCTIKLSVVGHDDQVISPFKRADI